MKVLVTGGCFTGLLVGYLMADFGYKVNVVETVKTNNKIDAFYYADASHESKWLLKKLGVEFSEFGLMCGVLEGGKVVRINQSNVSSVQAAYWKKSRLVVALNNKGITQPEAKRGARCLAFSIDRVIDMLKEKVFISTYAPKEFDLHLATRPLWEYPEVGAIDAMAANLNLVIVKPLKDPFIGWDIIYTPFTPDDSISRVRAGPNGDYICEVVGPINDSALLSDLNFLFTHGWRPVAPIKTTYGCLLPLCEKPVWPENTIPIGTMAEWDESITLKDIIIKTRSVALKYAK